MIFPCERIETEEDRAWNAVRIEMFQKVNLLFKKIFNHGPISSAVSI